MGFKAKGASTVIRDLELAGACRGWKIRVRYIPPKQSRELMLDASSGGSFDEKKYLRKYVEAAIDGWSGCTPEHIASLVELDEGGDPLPTDSDGCVPYSIDLALFLMQEAPADAFQNPIVEMSRTLLRRVALEKKIASSDSDA